MRVVYTNRAAKDLEIAFFWYNEQQDGLGNEFLDSVESSIKVINENPLLFTVVYKTFRRALIRKFPFAIYYTIEDSVIVIHALFDNRQDPEKRP